MKTTVQIILSCFIGLALWSCSSETDAYAKLVSEWQGREIVFPNIMTDVLTGDTIDLSDADFTILTYVDSIGCVSCRMKLPLWKEVINSLDSISDATINVLFIVNSNDKSMMSYILKRDSYDYPVYLDKGNSFGIINGISENTSFHSFLLDKYNNVLAIGNPALNNKITSLYKSIISGERTVSISHEGVIKVNKHNIDLGSVPSENEITKQFQIHNEGNDTVYIRNILSSCHCTDAIVHSDKIPPKAHIDAMVRFSADSISGIFNNTIQIFYVGFEYPSIIQLSGNVL